jgi:hypothetical protein
MPDGTYLGSTMNVQCREARGRLLFMENSGKDITGITGVVHRECEWKFEHKLGGADHAARVDLIAERK